MLPFAMVSVLVFSGTVYGMAGLRHDAGAFFTHYAVALLAYLIASQVSVLEQLCVSTLHTSQHAAYRSAACTNGKHTVRQAHC